MIYVEAPEEYDGDLPSIFLAGGITACPDWQAEVVAALPGLASNVAVFNPRRASFDVANPFGAAEQVAWEFRHLRRAWVTLFWFPACDPAVTVQPIALYELGAAAESNRLIAVGVDDGYPRAADVRMQLGLIRPNQLVHGSLSETVEEAVELVGRRALARFHRMPLC